MDTKFVYYALFTICFVFWIAIGCRLVVVMNDFELIKDESLEERIVKNIAIFCFVFLNIFLLTRACFYKSLDSMKLETFSSFINFAYPIIKKRKFHKGNFVMLCLFLINISLLLMFPIANG